MLLAETVSEGSNFEFFDVFVIVFTIIIGAGLFRLAKAPVKNKFALGFTAVSFLVFVVLTVLMIMNWFKVL